MKITKVLYQSRVSEVNATATNVLKAYTESGITDDATLQSFVDELTAVNDALTLAIDKDKAVSKLEEYDEIRDKAMQDLYHYIEGYTRVPNKSAEVPAKHVFDIFQKYGVGIVGLSYNEQSSKLDSLLKDLEIETNKTATESLMYVPQMIEALRKAQEDFSNVYVEQLRETGKEQTASDLKPQVLDIINNKLIVYLQAMITFNADVYGNLAKDVAIVINRNNEIVRERRRK